jgi:hypothetical protein
VQRVYPTSRPGRTLANHGSKKRLKAIERRLTRRDLLLVGAVLLLMVLTALASIASFLKHLTDDHSPRPRR